MDFILPNWLPVPSDSDTVTVLCQWVLLLLFASFLVLWLVNVVIGNRQRKEAGGSWGRLLIVAAALAIPQMGPLFAGGILYVINGSAIDMFNVFMAGVASCCICSFWTRLYMLPPTRWIGSREAMPQIDDVEFQNRLEGIAEKLGIKTPVVRLIPSAGGTMGLHGFAGGLPKPSLVLSDGIMLRFKEQETDAIVAHELAHLANRSLYYYPAVVCLCWTLGTLTSMSYTFLVAMLYSLAIYMGLGRAVSRYFEYDSDLRAARAVGHGITISALDKIHHGSPLSNSGWASYLAYSMATHPSHEERLSAIARDASMDERWDVTWSESQARRRRLGARTMAVVWLFILISTFMLPPNAVGGAVRAILLLSIVSAPMVTLRRAIRRDIRSEMNRMRPQRERTQWRLLLLLVGCVSFIAILAAIREAAETETNVRTGFDSTASSVVIDRVEGESEVGGDRSPPFRIQREWDDLNSSEWAALALFIFAVFIVIGMVSAGRTPQAKIRLAIHQRRWAEAMELGRKYVKKLKKDPASRHDLAYPPWMLGDQQGAIDRLECLKKDFPEFIQVWLTQALMHMERDEIEKALQLAEEVRGDLKNDIGPIGICARCYRLLGRIDNVEQQLTEMERLMPEVASVPALKCAIAIDLGDGEAALEHWRQADKLSPGDAFLYLLRSELELLFGNRTECEVWLEEARKLIQATHFFNLGAELRLVEQKLAAAQTGAGNAVTSNSSSSPPET